MLLIQNDVLDCLGSIAYQNRHLRMFEQIINSSHSVILKWNYLNMLRFLNAHLSPVPGKRALRSYPIVCVLVGD